MSIIEEWERRKAERRAAKRYFIYYLLDASGAPLYIGRSSDVPGRIRSHVYEATRGTTEAGKRKATWLPDVRSLTMSGPFTWDEAIAEERRLIELEQPRGNLALTVRDPRPFAAARSLANSKQAPA